MTLGHRLADTLAALHATNRGAGHARTKDQIARIQRQRAARAQVLEDAKAHLTVGIQEGLVPTFEIHDYDHQQWVKAATGGKTSDGDLWEGFLAWAQGQHLTLSTRTQHDGGGISSWVLIEVAPAPDTRPA